MSQTYAQDRFGLIFCRLWLQRKMTKYKSENDLRIIIAFVTITYAITFLQRTLYYWKVAVCPRVGVPLVLSGGGA